MLDWDVVKEISIASNSDISATIYNDNAEFGGVGKIGVSD